MGWFSALKPGSLFRPEQEICNYYQEQHDIPLVFRDKSDQLVFQVFCGLNSSFRHGLFSTVLIFKQCLAACIGGRYKLSIELFHGSRAGASVSFFWAR